MKHFVTTALIFATLSGNSTQWSCRNTDMEIVCDAGKCETSDSFTPLHVNFDDEGNISIGMYSVLWEGTGEVVTQHGFITIYGNQLVNISPAPREPKENFFIVVDTNDSMGLFKGYGFAMPMICSRNVKSDTK